MVGFQASMTDFGVRHDLSTALHRQPPTLLVYKAILMLKDTRKVSVPISPYQSLPSEGDA